jgi:hypothetical protein
MNVWHAGRIASRILGVACGQRSEKRPVHDCKNNVDTNLSKMQQKRQGCKRVPKELVQVVLDKQYAIFRPMATIAQYSILRLPFYVRY